MSARRAVPISVAVVWLAVGTGLLLRARPTHAESGAIARPEEVVRWARQNAIHLATLTAGGGFADMESLRKVIGGARVVALGEATHGTREFFQFKHRMFEFLVEKMGFTVFAIEANWPESLAVDDYVVNARGDPAEALAGLGFWTWDTEEVLDLIRWMRAWNDRPDHRRKLHFIGFDNQSPSKAAAAIRGYLSRVDPDFEATLAGALERLQKAGRASRSILETASVETRQAIGAIEPRLIRRRNDYERSSSRSEWQMAQRNAHALAQAVAILAESSERGPQLRDQFMAENIRGIVADGAPDTKVMVWGHNAHVSRGSGMMGSYLDRMFGRDFVNFGFAFGEGSFQAIDRTVEGHSSGLLKEFRVGAPPPESLDALWLSLGNSSFIVDLRDTPTAVANFLKGYRVTREIGAVFQGEHSMESRVCLPARYDGLVFIAMTTAAHPLFPRAASSQSRPGALARQPANLDLARGAIGGVPDGWIVPPFSARAGYRAALTADCGAERPRCVELSGKRAIPHGFGNLMQTFDAGPLRGSRVRFRANVKAAVTGEGNQGALWMRIDRANGGIAFFDNMADRPIVSDVWRMYEVAGEVSADAETIHIGVMLIGDGTVWFTSAALDIVKPTESVPTVGRQR